ncbi:MAG: FtsQ-type POTRA domain-containing protein, partial [Acidobacteria bacterium]|nr:FtsQ-type POTRA domain-containing protein [Acidobacteriota bacterium]
ELNISPSFNYTVKKQPAVKKNSKKLTLFMVFGILVAASLSLYAWMSQSFSLFSFGSVFSLRKITVYGVEGTNADLIKQSLSGFSGKNLLAISSEQIKENISKFGFVEGFLLRKTYPSEITVEIKVKPSAGCVKKQNIFYDIDGEGSAWESSLSPENYIEADSTVDLFEPNFQKIIKELNEINCIKAVSTIQRRTPDSYIITTKDKIKIVVSGKDFKSQWEKYLKTKSFIRKNFGQDKTIDLRWSNRVVLPVVEKSAPAEEGLRNG